MAKIMLDKERNFKLNLNAMERFEIATGRRLFKMQALDELSVHDLKALLWSGLFDDDPNLTMDEVGAMVDTSNMTSISEAIKVEITGGEQSKNPL